MRLTGVTDSEEDLMGPSVRSEPDTGEAGCKQNKPTKSGWLQHAEDKIRHEFVVDLLLDLSGPVKPGVP
jgi:hypothetical protein